MAKNEQTFSLLELMIIITVLGIGFSLLFSNSGGIQDEFDDKINFIITKFGLEQQFHYAKDGVYMSDEEAKKLFKNKKGKVSNISNDISEKNWEYVTDEYRQAFLLVIKTKKNGRDKLYLAGDKKKKINPATEMDINKDKITENPKLFKKLDMELFDNNHIEQIEEKKWQFVDKTFELINILITVLGLGGIAYLLYKLLIPKLNNEKSNENLEDRVKNDDEDNTLTEIETILRKYYHQIQQLINKVDEMQEMKSEKERELDKNPDKEYLTEEITELEDNISEKQELIETYYNNYEKIKEKIEIKKEKEERKELEKETEETIDNINNLLEDLGELKGGM